VTAPGLLVVAYGHPAPQGSKRHVGRGVMVESSKHVKPWREAVKNAALDAREEWRTGWFNDHWTPLDGPLVAHMVFTLRKPASAPKRRRTWPDRTPDLSKLARATEDALVDAGVIADDARIVEYARLAKVFPGEDMHALHTPGVRIQIWRMTAEESA
jgi:Holliday junction resolvase RusA-like endonuclease